MMRYLLTLLAVAGSGYGLAEQPTSSVIPDLGALPQSVGPIEKAVLQEDAFPLTSEIFSKPQRLDFDFSFPAVGTDKPWQIDVPIRFDAPPTLAAVTYFR